MLFPVADLGATPLATLLRVGAAGAEVRGKRARAVVYPFRSSSGAVIARVEAAYRGNFSPLQASVLVFSSDLSPSLSPETWPSQLLEARRGPSSPNRFCNLALLARASGTPLARALYLADLSPGTDSGRRCIDWLTMSWSGAKLSSWTGRRQARRAAVSQP